jgi:hypothetical protein
VKLQSVGFKRQDSIQLEQFALMARDVILTGDTAAYPPSDYLPHCYSQLLILP